MPGARDVVAPAMGRRRLATYRWSRIKTRAPAEVTVFTSRSGRTRCTRCRQRVEQGIGPPCLRPAGCNDEAHRKERIHDQIGYSRPDGSAGFTSPGPAGSTSCTSRREANRQRPEQPAGEQRLPGRRCRFARRAWRPRTGPTTYSSRSSAGRVGGGASSSLTQCYAVQGCRRLMVATRGAAARAVVLVIASKPEVVDEVFAAAVARAM